MNRLVLGIVLLLAVHETAIGAVAPASSHPPVPDVASVITAQKVAGEQGGDQLPEVIHSGDRQRAEALIREAEGLRTLGFYGKAIDALREASVLSQGNQQTEALVLNAMGNVFQLAGMLTEARSYLERSISLAQGADREDIHAAALNNLGNLDMVEQQYAAALANYEASTRLAIKTSNALLQAQALINGARAAEQTGNTEKLASLLGEAITVSRGLNDSSDKANDLIAIGQLYALSGGTAGTATAYAAFTQALSISEKVSDLRAQSYAQGYLGQLYEKERRYGDALELTRRAIFIAEELNAPEMLYRWYWQKGRLHKAQNKQDEAIAAYRQAVTNLQSIRNDLSQNYASGQSSFRKVFSPLYFELADLLLQRASGAGENEVESYLNEARDTVEQSKTAELQDYFQDSCVTSTQSRIVQGNQFGEHTAIVYPILLQDRMELLVTLPRGIKQFRVPLSSRVITEEIRVFRTKLEKRTTREYIPHAQKLYTWIIKPFEAELAAQQVDTLVFIPDGPLRTIPMSALHDGNKYLIESYSLATTPGLTLTDPHSFQNNNVRVLLNGLTESVQGFSSLPNVNSELTAIGKMYNGTVLKDGDYVLSKVKEKMGEKPYTVVHIASHGQFQGDSSKTFLLTHDEKLTLNQLEKLIAPSRYRDQPLELLTLSACQTAAGDDRAALGLAGIAIKAGARSALASLWFINDSSSSVLISKFYEYLKQPGNTKAKALQQAQVDLIKDSRFRHPGYWAPFLLIGNWL
ncbi:MAG TPA: CHAT domain-containing protein [Gallionella sp.]|nr:CHAT domain-containing protein [Gallionella sp.]